ncbi:MAG: protein translocase subunit SecD [Chthonomonas sp.]|nr:protein translocase subunit SecD [Chthonomonas sp.]
MQSGNKGYLFLVVVLALAALSGWLYKQPAYDYKFGLDIKGGVRLTYKVKELTEDQRRNLPVIMDNLQTIMSGRASASLGVVEGNVQRKGEDEMIVELPNFTDAEMARQTMSSTASIKLYHAKNVVTERIKFRDYVIAGRDDATTDPVQTFSKRNDPQNRILKPGDPEYLNMIKGWTLILEGTDLAKAMVEIGPNNSVTPMFNFSSEGARKLEAWSRQFSGQQENVAFVLDGKVLNIAPVQRDAILSDHAVLTGQFTASYANNLVSLLNAGALPVELEETSSQVVDPTIGKFALSQMITAGIAAFAFTALFLIIYYFFPGFVALIALCLYVLFTITAMKMLNATFSLAAIAGFILSVGMAVDANILVFERVKEEMRDGRSLMTAVELGFKRALPAIIDSNACTILTSLVLMQLGQGPVKGFATTLVIGVAISLFTAVTITRSLLVFFVSSGIVKSEKLFAAERGWFGEKLEATAHEKPLQVVNNSRRYFMISLLTIIPGLIFVFLGGLKPNVEFQGGFEAVYKLQAGATTPEVVKNLETAGFKGSNAKITTDKGEKYVAITVPPSDKLKSNDPGAYNTLAQAAGVVTKLPVTSITSVGPAVQQESIRNAILAVIISSALIVFYLALRFGLSMGGFHNGLKFGMSAILALVHDIFVVLGVAAIMGFFAGWELSALFITSMLTVIGFSVHDTIVIFDRIRENLRKPMKGEDFGNLCNRSITQSIARSINTSMTVIVTLLILVIMGTPTIDLKFFCVVMLTGILSGTYSSIFNAAPILYLWDRRIARTRGEEHSLIAEATAEMNRLRAQAMQTQVASGPSTASGANRGYSQVKRRDSAIDRSKSEIDD